jgi:hypothetical protein
MDLMIIAVENSHLKQSNHNGVVDLFINVIIFIISFLVVSQLLTSVHSTITFFYHLTIFRVNNELCCCLNLNLGTLERSGGWRGVSPCLSMPLLPKAQGSCDHVATEQQGTGRE